MPKRTNGSGKMSGLWGPLANLMVSRVTSRTLGQGGITATDYPYESKAEYQGYPAKRVEKSFDVKKFRGQRKPKGKYMEFGQTLGAKILEAKKAKLGGSY